MGSSGKNSVRLFSQVYRFMLPLAAHHALIREAFIILPGCPPMPPAYNHPQDTAMAVPPVMATPVP
jgi:hypothetical protein